ncbi:myosin heavy chain-related protein [Striga asiatica]|uniref:Myosin heavy chain-related protein n=1 Tax=Striga asiatica TaxID=4170 RepID=A0A5A7RCL5_STRAF|nr:myosin heavy chain-related protein [Striga asiatica]
MAERLSLKNDELLYLKSKANDLEKQLKCEENTAVAMAERLKMKEDELLCLKSKVNDLEEQVQVLSKRNIFRNRIVCVSVVLFVVLLFFLGSAVRYKVNSTLPWYLIKQLWNKLIVADLVVGAVLAALVTVVSLLVVVALVDGAFIGACVCGAIGACVCSTCGGAVGDGVGTGVGFVGGVGVGVGTGVGFVGCQSLAEDSTCCSLVLGLPLFFCNLTRRILA